MIWYFFEKKKRYHLKNTETEVVFVENLSFKMIIIINK